jgi:Domain of unknown function (DUF4307)
MTSAPASEPPQGARPADRYGDVRSPSRRWLGVAGLGLLAAAGLAWVLWAGAQAAQRDVRWSDVGYRVVDDTTVEVTFTVVKEPTATVECTVQALDGTFARVGLTTTEVGPGPRRGVTSTAVVRTQQRAVTGVVEACRVV